MAQNKPPIESVEARELRIHQERVGKYAKRFVNVYNLIQTKEGCDVPSANMSMQTALAVVTLNKIVEDVTANEGTVNDMEKKVHEYMHGFNELFITHFEQTVNQIMAMMREKENDH